MPCTGRCASRARSPSRRPPTAIATSPRAAWPKRIAAWASLQSEPLASRAALISSVAEAAERFGTPVPGAAGVSESEEHDVPRPPHWGGYRLWVDAVELWVEGDARVHDRARWTRTLSRAERWRLPGRALVGDAPAALTPPASKSRGADPFVWKTVRICVLLILLALVAGQQLLERVATQSWKETLWVGIFPLNADGSAGAQQYIESLTPRDFAALETFFSREAHRYGVALETPVHIELYPQGQDLPPALPRDAGPFRIAWWSLRLRWFAFRHSEVPGQAPLARAHLRPLLRPAEPARSPRLARAAEGAGGGGARVRG